MAIKTSSQGTLPAVDLDHIQYNEFHMSVAEAAPHNIALSAKLRPYGVSGTEKFYAKDFKLMNIGNLDAYIATKVPTARQAEAVAALTKVQEGLGTLASIYLGIDFIGVE